MYSPEWKKRGVVDAEVMRLKIIYISKFRKDIKPLKIKFRKTIRNGARIYTPASAWYALGLKILVNYTGHLKKNRD